jgi:hypothetical protein
VDIDLCTVHRKCLMHNNFGHQNYAQVGTIHLQWEVKHLITY